MNYQSEVSKNRAWNWSIEHWNVVSWAVELELLVSNSLLIQNIWKITSSADISCLLHNIFKHTQITSELNYTRNDCLTTFDLIWYQTSCFVVVTLYTNIITLFRLSTLCYWIVLQYRQTYCGEINDERVFYSIESIIMCLTNHLQRLFASFSTSFSVLNQMITFFQGNSGFLYAWTDKNATKLLA